MEFVTTLVGSIVTKAVEYTISPIKNHVKYLSNHQQYVETLKDRAERLKDARDRVQHSVDAAKRNGEETEADAGKWLSAADKKILEQVEKVMQDEEKAKKKCFIGLCPNFRTRYKLSLKAEEEAKAVAELLEHGKFERVSYRAVPQGIVVAPVKGYEEFESRTSILNGIMEALKDDSVSVVGVHGMGGIGKTTLVKEIARKVKGRLFDSVVIATVTQAIDIEKIQNQIADFLGLKFEEQSMVGKAFRLRERLKKEERILVVLDDIWGKVDIEEVGIPLGDEHKGCKLLLTSRELNVLSNGMDAQKNFPIGFLNEKEAWELFKKKAGDCDESCDLKPIATEVAKKCAGLPIAIETVAGALRNKRLFEWKNALRELERPSSSNFTGIAAAYSAIEWSFNYLESEEIKLTFLLCSVIGHNGLVEDLVRYTLGLGLFDGVHTMEEARNKVLTVVANLKASALLLDSYNDKLFDIHDVVWDAAIAIALKDYRMLVLRDHAPKEWSDKEKMKTWSVISLRCPQIIANLPKEMECSGLSFCHMAYDGAVKIPLNFFKQTEGLKALDLVGMQFPSLPESIIHLADLRMLCLKRCAVDNITILGELKNLEILDLAASGIKELPKEMAQLTQLRLLDLRGCRELKIIPPNVLSGLSKLEELYMSRSFVEWEKGGVVENERKNASLDELNNLPCLTTLYVHILDVQMIPKHRFVETLDRFRIFVGNYGMYDCCNNYESPKALKLMLYTNIDLDNGMKKLLIKTEDLCLEGLEGVKNVLVELNNGKDLPNLKRLHVKNGRHVQYIKTNKIGFSELCFITLENLPQLVSFCSPDERCSTKPLLLLNKQTCHWITNLRSLIIKGCGKLEHLLSPSLARSLVQLQCFEIEDCNCLRDIILTEEIEEERKDVICFPRLNSLRIDRLPNLIFFSSGNHNIEFPLLKKLEIKRCPKLIDSSVAVPSLEDMTIWDLSNVKMIFYNDLPPGSFKNLRKINVWGCGSLKNLFPASIAKDLPQLEHLSITDCGVEEIVSKGDGVEEQPVIPKLEELELRIFGDMDQFPPDLFQHVKVFAVRGASRFFSFPPLRRFYNLERLEVSHFDFKHVVPCKGGAGTLPPIRNLKLDSARNLKHIWRKGSELDHILSNLQTLTVHNCDNWINIRVFSSSLQNLRILNVSLCKMMTNLVTPSVLKNLVQLTTMIVRGCTKMTEIVGNEGDCHQTIVVSELKCLQLCNMKSLTSFCPRNYNFEFPCLEELVVERCPRLKIFSEGVLSTPQLQRIKQSRFSNKWSWRSDLNTTIQQLYTEKVQNILDFKILSSLQFYKCSSLKYIFTPSMLLSLNQLHWLEVKECSSMEQVVREEEEAMTHKFTFLSLLSVTIESCSNLTNFHLGSQALEFPMLTKDLVQLRRLRILDCNMMEQVIFTDGLVENYFEFHCLAYLTLRNCPLLKTFISKCVPGDEPQIGQHEQASNLEVQNSSLLNEKDTFPVLEELTLKTNDLVKGICDEQLSLQCFQNLKLLNLHCFRKRSTTLPYWFIRSLPKLQKLVIKNASISEIVRSEGLSDEERHTSAFYQLKELSLTQLPGLTLKTFEPSLLSFKNLTTLEVSRCHGFINLIACSTAKCLTLLERLSIDDCEMIEEIIACEAEEIQGGIVFPKLKYLQLSCLPCLASFSLAHHSLEFPVLLMVMVTKCPQMRNFCQGDLSTPRLEQMHLTRDEEGELQNHLKDLNSCVFTYIHS
uniref:Uncharacterized protein n=1 Tax=Gossypium raimondii TaxID=29730 RepID=A0A0D2RTE3_GOSRA|nr:hypothetical protein B456_011G265100 [Gossypium raimondii]